LYKIKELDFILINIEAYQYLSKDSIELICDVYKVLEYSAERSADIYAEIYAEFDKV